MLQPSIDELSRMLFEDVDEQLVTVAGFGRMTRQQALQTTITYLRQMAEKLEEGVVVPLHYFDLAQDHYKAVIEGQIPQP